MAEDDRWLRKFFGFEEIIYKGFLQDFYRIRYTLTLNAAKPLNPEDVRITLLHLYRKIPTLRLCLQSRNGDEIWFREMEKETIKFQNLEESCFDEEFYKYHDQKFNLTNGPLWSAKIFPNSRECTMPEVKTNFPYQYKIIFCFHHTITDGTSNVQICNNFLNLLNDVIDGKVIDDNVQFGKFVSPDDFNHLIEPLEIEMTQESKRFLDCKANLEEFEQSPNYFGKAFESPSASDIAEHITYDFSEKTTNQMIAKCKSHGVTMNSFLSTVVNAGIYELLQKTQFAGQKEYSIPTGHCVNNRRYLNTDEKLFGCFISFPNILVIVKPDIKHTFWEYVSKLNEQLHSRMTNMGAFEDHIVDECIHKDCLHPFASDDPKAILNMSYFTANMGNMAKSFPGTGDNVQATYIHRSTSLKKFNSSHDFHTFRGRLLFSINYWPPLMPKEIAQLWMDTNVEFIDSILATE